MPSLLKSPCRVPGCTGLGTRGYCDTHAKDKEQAYQRMRQSSHERGYTAEWRKARLMFLKRHPLCVHCLERGDYTPATDVDHIIPHRGDRDRFWNVQNWQPLCRSCHSAKTAKEDSRWG